jgi:hypothetical protein
MPLPKLFELGKLAGELEQIAASPEGGSVLATPGSGRGKAKQRAQFGMTPSPHYAGLHPGLSYGFGRPGSGEVIRIGKDGKPTRTEEAADESAENEFDSLMGWANDTSEEPATTQASSSSYPKKPLSPAEVTTSPSPSPSRADGKMPASPARGSPSPTRQSPLQTIVEEKPDVELPECLKSLEESPEEEA